MWRWVNDQSAGVLTTFHPFNTMVVTQKRILPMNTTSLERIFVFPIKSLDGVAVESATILAGGSLQYDREFAIVDADHKVVNAKRFATIQKLRAQFDLAQRLITIAVPQAPPQTFHLDADRPALATWLSDYFGFAVQLQQNCETGFPDDLISPGPTIISSATLATVSQWFPVATIDSIRRRLRTNLELATTEAFWEDRLFASSPIGFTIGDVAFQGINPCQRCIVPTRDPITADPTPKFQATFVQQRQTTLPQWVDPTPFNHFYRLAVNTRLPTPSIGKTLRIGDRLAID
jgi:uncharacterized protein